ncbi:TonB-dependent receptor plug domain-containing protein [Parablastomonas sp. CN1-191]|uniref:TonB-dependent receptor plug domain-containing protein n=1 Tax=Parablastomonas sp. CN1-191 TaxID=3400908 RepID=UPI003BF7A6EE
MSMKSGPAGRVAGTSVLVIAAVLVAAPAVRAKAATDPAPAATAAADAAAAARQVFAPDYFARFAPRTAWDMVVQLPGFSVRDNDQSRGIGNATGNILINGERPTNKTDSFQTQLSRIPASSVVRIEVVDGATLALPGLSGQVGNIVVNTGGTKGQFSWTPELRAHYSDPIVLRGEVSLSGKSGRLDWTTAFAVEGDRSGAGGPTTITLGDGALLETRDDRWRSNWDQPKLSGRLAYDLGGGAKANLNASVQRGWNDYREVSARHRPAGIDRNRLLTDVEDTWGYEIAGDVTAPAAGGTLKLIGLRRFADSRDVSAVVTRLVDGSPPLGDLYRQHTGLGETIGRAEFGWKMLGGDWQLSGEGAFNRLSSIAATGDLRPDDTFVESPFEPGTGRVGENRYNASLSYGTALSPKLNLQAVAEAEYSTISQGGAGGLSRSFFRPKGSLSLAWKPRSDFDLSGKVMRRVLQLSLYEFLGKRFLNDGNENAGNAALVPQQDWSIEMEANKRLGRWGSSKLRLVTRFVQDLVAVVPLPGGGESTGNIAKARASAIDWSATLNLDPMGFKGAKVDLRALLQTSSLVDPLTGARHQYNGFTSRVFDLSLRHDIPGSDWAWGTSLEYFHNEPSYRLQESGSQFEGPFWGEVFVENKDVAGLTVKVAVNNLFNARSRWDRTVYSGPRDVAPVAFYEDRNRLIGPMFRFSVRGNF